MLSENGFKIDHGHQSIQLPTKPLCNRNIEKPSSLNLGATSSNVMCTNILFLVYFYSAMHTVE